MASQSRAALRQSRSHQAIQRHFSASGLTRRSSGPAPAGQACGFPEHCARRCGPLNSGVRHLANSIMISRFHSRLGSAARARRCQSSSSYHHQPAATNRRLASVLEMENRCLIECLGTRAELAFSERARPQLVRLRIAFSSMVSSTNPSALSGRLPNPTVKRTHTGGAHLLVSQALRAPVCAAYLRR